MPPEPTPGEQGSRLHASATQRVEARADRLQRSMPVVAGQPASLWPLRGPVHRVVEDARHVANGPRAQGSAHTGDATARPSHVGVVVEVPEVSARHLAHHEEREKEGELMHGLLDVAHARLDDGVGGACDWDRFLRVPLPVPALWRAQRRSRRGLGRSQDYSITRLDTLVVDGRNVASHAEPLLL